MTDSQLEDRLFRPGWGWLGWASWILAVALLIEWVFGVGAIGQTARNACSVAFWLLIGLLAFDGRRRRKRRSVPLPD
jgi:hypothetical protein